MTRDKCQNVVCRVSARIPSAVDDIGTFRLCIYDCSSSITPAANCGDRLNEEAGERESHMAIVFGNGITSKSLNEIQSETETSEDRRVRGAIVCGSAIEQRHADPVLVRIHSSCYTGETLLSSRCDCGDQLETAMKRMADRGEGVIVYMNQEGRGIGIVDKLKAYNLQDMGYDTVSANLYLKHPADGRQYDVAACILRDLGIERVELLTNNPLKIKQLEQEGIQVVKRVELIPKCVTAESETGDHVLMDKRLRKEHKVLSKELGVYLHTKVHRMDHLIDELKVRRE